MQGGYRLSSLSLDLSIEKSRDNEESLSIARGLQAGLVNFAEEAQAFQAAMLVNNAKVLKGAQLGLFFGVAREAYGIQWGHVLAGFSMKKFNGFQFSGFVNKANEMNGLQLAMFNSSQGGSLVQLGLLNIIDDNPWYARYMPLMNMRFN